MYEIEEEYNKVIEYLAQRYKVTVQYDYIAEPNNKNTQDKLYKVWSGDKDIMWVYLKLGRMMYASIETDPEYIDEIRENIKGFDEIIENRKHKHPTKLVFRDFSVVENSIKDIVDAIDDHIGVKTISMADSINVPMLPKQIVENKDDYIVTCKRCGLEFNRANRCTNCGQMLEWPSDDDLSKFLIRPMNQKRKLNDIYDWAKVTAFNGINREQAIEIAERFIDLGFVAQVGTTDVNMVYQENDGKKMYGFFFFGDGKCCGFQPAEIIEYAKYKDIDEDAIKKEFLEEIRKYLSPKQKNEPYTNIKGYYFIDCSIVFEHLNEITGIYSKLLSRLSNSKQ